MRPSSSSSSSSSSGSVPLTRINSPRRQMILPPPSPPPVSDSIRFPILRPLHHLPSYDFIMMESNRQDVLILFCINDNKSSCSLKKPPSRSVSLLGHPFVHEKDLDTSKFIILKVVFFFLNVIDYGVFCVLYPRSVLVTLIVFACCPLVLAS